MSKRSNSPDAGAALSSLQFSALVEIVGIQDVAEEDVAKFTQRTNHFRDRLREVLAGKDIENRGIGIRTWLDRCYLQCPSATWLLHCINRLRYRLLVGGEPVFVRVVVNRGGAFGEDDTFLENSALLADQLMKFKAVGVMVSDAVREATLKEQASVSAVTQSAPPDGHLLGFKVHHLRM